LNFIEQDAGVPAASQRGGAASEAKPVRIPTFPPSPQFGTSFPSFIFTFIFRSARIGHHWTVQEISSAIHMEGHRCE
jgi:hypothetical protein